MRFSRHLCFLGHDGKDAVNPMNTLSIVRDFAKAPGPRYVREGKNSGEDFRKRVFVKAVREAISRGEQLTVDLDGTYGFATSFLEESFGGLVRDEGISIQDLRRILHIVSDEEPELIAEIWSYVEDAWADKEGGSVQ